MMGNRGVIGKFKQNTDFGGRLGSQEAYLLSAGGFYPRFVAAASGPTLISESSYTVFLAKASGNDGTNTTINDASDNEHSITVNGNAVAQSFTPYHPGGYSVYFDGTGDYLSYNPGASIAFGTGDFTVEAWVYHTVAPGGIALIDTRGGGTANWGLFRDSTNGGRIQWYTGSSNTYSTGTNKWSAQNKWLHIAYCRSGTTGYFFINGELLNTQTDSTNYSTSSTETTIGARYSQDTIFHQGYIKDLRIVKGTALYTATFTPATEPLTTTSQGATASEVELLTCHAPFIGDGSTNAHTITVAGNTKTERFGPYDYLAYNVSNHGASVYFDGTGDYLTAADDATLQPGSSNFTYEAWIYPTSAPNTYNSIFYKRSTGSNYSGVAIAIKSSGVFSILVASGSSSWGIVDESSASYKLNEWQHIAAVRSGSSFKFYVNGVQKISTTISFSVYDMGSSQSIGAGAANGDQPFTGYIADARIVKGSAVYTSAFTPPTSALAKIDGTSLLTCNTQPNVFDASGIDSPLILNGNAKSSTAQTKNASSSIAFDGTGDYLSLSDDALLQMESGDFTIEAWVYVNAHKNSNYIYSYSYPYQFSIDSNGHLESYFNDGDNFNSYITVQGSTAISTSTWTHVAVVRNGNTFTQFVNGVQDGTTTSSATLGTPSTYDPRIGDWGGGSYSFNGYLEDFRITKDLSRYPFISPRKTLTSSDQANTKLIACHSSTATTDGAGLQTITENGTPLAGQAGPYAGMFSVYFDGSNEALRTNDNSSLNLGTEDFTIEAWIKPDNTTTAYRAIVSDNIYGQTSGSWCIYQYGTTLQISANTGSGGAGISTLGASGNTLLSAGVWSHIAFTRTSGTARLFHNGVQVGSDTSLSTDFTDDQILIGANNHADGYPNYDFIGYISNVRVIKGTSIYNKTFTPPTAELTA